MSGDGEKLAVIIDQEGRSTVELRDLRNDRKIPLRHLYRHQPHSSPSLSWNGRYLAVITQRGNHRVVIIEDLLTGKLHNIPIRGGSAPIGLHLSPDASKIALQLINQGKWQVEVFDLTNLLEPDLPSGIIKTTQAINGQE